MKDRKYFVLILILFAALFEAYHSLRGTAQSVVYIVCSLAVMALFFRRVQIMANADKPKDPD
jgi:cytochrome bd-type quinol oxidase subunit 2